MDSIPLKRCCRCHVSYPATPDFFNRSRQYKDGLHPECRSCRKQFRPRKTNRLIIPVLWDGDLKRCTACQEWLIATAENFDKHGSGFHPRCKECRRVEKLLERLNHPERIRERRRPYFNRPDVKRRAVERTKQWEFNNPERAKSLHQAQTLRYRAKKSGLALDYTADDWERCLRYFGYCCAVCGRPRGLWHTLAQDHWIPVTDSTCPGTVPHNIVHLCQGAGGCNNAKGGKHPRAWLIERFGKAKAAKIIRKVEQYFHTIANTLPHD